MGNDTALVWKEKEPMNEQATFKVGQTVWVNFFSVQQAKDGPGYEVKAFVRERTVFKIIPNYLDKFGLHYKIGRVGNRCMAYRPERVFETCGKATAEMRNKMRAHVEAVMSCVPVREGLDGIKSDLNTLKQQDVTVEEVERIGVEFGFKCAEKGMNLEETLEKLAKLKAGK